MDRQTLIAIIAKERCNPPSIIPNAADFAAAEASLQAYERSRMCSRCGSRLDDLCRERFDPAMIREMDH